MSNARTAALTLHALPPADREWILQRLDPPLRERLQQWLAELAGLGIPSERGLIEEALATRQALTEPGWRDQLALQDAEAIARVLAGEPAAVVARVLAAGPWPWEEQALALLPEAQQAAVGQWRASLEVGSVELDEWLAQRLAEHCARAVPAEPAAVAGLLPLKGETR